MMKQTQWKTWLLIILVGICVACNVPLQIIQVQPDEKPEPYFQQILSFFAPADPTTMPTVQATPTVALSTKTPTPIPTSSLAVQSDTDEPVGRIIYTCQVDKNPSHDQVCMINADGTGFTQLTGDLTTAHFYPSWLPDGTGFLYSGVDNGEFKIFKSSFSGEAEVLIDVPGSLFAPMASPNGTCIIFTRHINEISQFVSVYELEKNTSHDLTGYYDAKDPVWSPDGSKILFTSLEDNTPQLYFMNADGTFVQKITELAGLRGRTTWSIDLSIATYAGEFEEHNREIVLLKLGGEPQVITDGGDNLAPSFSPDGQWIVFMSYRDHFWEADGCELYIMRTDGSDVRRLTNNEYCDYQPRWEP